jgi:hypothetical protein
VSFDLGFWWERHSVSPAEAARKYGALVAGDTGIADEHPALEAFYAELTIRFPDLSEENFESSPWAAPLYKTSECVIVSISHQRKLDTCAYLLGLASRGGVTCFDPQSGKVHVPKGEGSATLELASGAIIDGPSPDDVTRALRKLSSEDWYVILEKRPGWFIQVGFGVDAGAPAGSYVLEFKEGPEGKHFRAVVGELPRIIETFNKFLSGDSSWRSGFKFSPIFY